jgi:protein SHQ1
MDSSPCILVTVHANPYFLRLNFPKAIVEDDDSSAKYDPASGYLTVTLTKENAGEVFNDLDLLAKLLSPRKTGKKTTTSIEVISSSNNTESELDELSSRTGVLSLEDDEVSDG